MGYILGLISPAPWGLEGDENVPKIIYKSTFQGLSLKQLFPIFTYLSPIATANDLPPSSLATPSE